MTSIYLAAFLCAALSSLLMTWGVRRAAIHWGLVSAPASSRHQHVLPMPRLGGVAIYLVFTGMMIGGMFLNQWKNVPSNTTWPTLLSLLGAGTIVFLIGLYDDLFGVSAWWKILVEIAAALLLVSTGFEVGKIGLLFSNHPVGALVGAVCTVLWVLVITNAFNLIDGLDGLAAGSAFCSTLIVFLAVLFTTRVNSVMLMTLVLAGAILGFLRFNFNPASIFLGDSGSLFIGFILSSVSLIGSTKSSTAVAVGVPVIAFGLPILDTTVAIVRRFVGGKPLFQADDGHIHHRLMQKGWSHKSAVMLLYLVTAIFGALSLLLVSTNLIFGVLVFVSVALAVSLGVRYLGYLEFSEIGRVAGRVISQRRIMTNNLALRRALSLLSECRTLPDLRQILWDAFAENDFDAFLLEFHPVPKSAALPEGFIHNGKGSVCLQWGEVEAMSTGWSLHLALPLLDENSGGSFTVHSRFSGEPLMVDINMLTLGFTEALAGALLRCRENMEPLPAAVPAVTAVPGTLPLRPH